MNSFGDRIKRIRKLADMTQGKLADKIGVAQSTVGNWERSKRTPTLDDLVAVNDACKETVGDSLIFLMTGQDLETFKHSRPSTSDIIKKKDLFSIFEKWLMSAQFVGSIECNSSISDLVNSFRSTVIRENEETTKKPEKAIDAIA
ncbi:helix-turn-helix domain-containing protein [Glaciecola sp. KUL10]|uniref:helix-turn-helix domain-containing protein n=1 Tax=Glaciecola sp. (strain KUL10) TaxID=2161813 RepID=UPI000D782158|nr:helix-turn-helix transcriptional regulator [Glaciecola sp. KUL10]GBL02949.1 Cro/CI family transcriptional regulator [Glaciecola sp. KUL10]